MNMLKDVGMTEAMLVDLMSDLDVHFLENHYLEQDIRSQRLGLFRRKRATAKSFKKGNEFVLSDSLKDTVYEQRELYDNIVAMPMEESGDLCEGKLYNSKRNNVIPLVSTVAAMFIVAVGIFGVLTKKKGILKWLGKRFQPV